jgi:hypothetical protein
LVSRRKGVSVREQVALIFRPKKVKIREDWRKLHNEKLHDLYFSNITVTKSKRKYGWGMWKAGGEEKCIHRCGWKT